MTVLSPIRGGDQAARLSPWGAEPGRLWSLWDIMRRFDVSFYMLMADFLARQEYAPVGRIQRWVFNKFFGRGENYEEKDLLQMIRFYRILNDDCKKLGMLASTATVDKILSVLEGQSTWYHNASNYSTELRDRLEDEFRQRFFLALNLDGARYYSQPREGWVEVIDRYPGAGTDIEEARKCFALSRYAASVFHSLQVVEVGVIDLGRLLGVKDPHPGWTATTAKLKRIIDTKYQDRTPYQRQHIGFLEQTQALTEVLKTAWRNKISHAHGKLTLLSSEFTPEITEEILFASRSFMRRLAVDAPTDPDPGA